MTPRVTRTLALVATFASAGLLSACGGAHPGVAAEIGDETIAVSEVNRLAQGFCDAAERDFQSQGNAYPMGVLAEVVLRSLASNAAIDQLAAERSVEPTTSFLEQQADREQSFSSLPEDQADAAVLVQGSSLYRDDILTQIGRTELEGEGIESPGVDDSLARGNVVLDQWLAVNEPVVDPQYRLSLDARPSAPENTSTSYAVSTSAVDAQLADAISYRDFVDDEGERFSTYVRTLPESQRCG